MPKITYGGTTIACEKGENLRDILIKNGIYPHNGASRYINCFGLGTCGTCAVSIDGETNEMTKQETLRLSLAPHCPKAGLRLSCQVRVLNDIQVKKHEGFWGQNLLEDPE